MFALVIGLIGEFVVPTSEQAAAQLRIRATNRIVAQEFRSGLWLKDGRVFVNVKGATPEAGLQGVRVYEFGSANELVSVTDAERGHYLGSETWQLEGVVRTVLGREAARVERVESTQWHSSLNPDILSVLMVSPDKMSVFHLISFTKHLIENNQKSERYQIALWKKFLHPLAALVMVTLALPCHASGIAE